MSVRPSRLRRSKTEERTDESDDPMSPKSAVDEDMVEEKSQSVKLNERLEALRALRDNIDADILAVERTMEIL